MPTQRTARAKNDGPESQRLRTVSSISGTAVAFSLSSTEADFNAEIRDEHHQLAVLEFKGKIGQSRLIREDRTVAVRFLLTRSLVELLNSG